MSRGGRESRVVLPWERPTSSLAAIVRRRARAALALALGVLGVYALVRVEDYHRKAHATRAAIRSIMLAVDAFRADHGRCPSGLSELVAPPQGASPYLADARLDGWGRPFHFTCPGRKHAASADVVSGGPTGTFLDLEQLE